MKPSAWFQIALGAALGGLAGCRTPGPPPPPVPPPAADARTFELPREQMVFRRISPAAHGRDAPDFWMLETEVTNESYARFLKAAKRSKGDAKLLRRHLRLLRQGHSAPYAVTGVMDLDVNPALAWNGSRPPAGQEDWPVALVTVHDAEDFCAWLTSRHPELGTFRLPTDVEWLVAAYGKDRQYPWGDEWRDDAFHHTHRPPPPPEGDWMALDAWNDIREKAPEPVRARPQGRTPEGLYAMWGNIEEMVIHPSNVVNAVVLDVGSRWMGGSFQDANRQRSGSDRVWTPFRPREDYWGFSHGDRIRSQTLGFRVVLDPNDKEHAFQPRAPYNSAASW